MSAVSLLYPTRPTEVADDMESFIYVILYMAFRFHRHSRTPPGVKKTDSERKRRYENSKNEAFAKIVDAIFYEDDANVAGYYTGGWTKLLYIEVGRPPIRLLRTGENTYSLLDLFLKNAYRILQSHYQAIDWELLKPYEAPVPVDPEVRDTSSDSQDEISKPQKEVVRDDDLWGGDPSENETVDAVEHNPPSDAARSHSPVGELSDRPSRLLDDHNAMEGLFRFVFKDASGRLRDMDQYRDEKHWDQFDGLQAIIGKSMMNSSGEKKRVTRDETNDAPSPAPKRPKIKARGHVQHLFTVPEDDETDSVDSDVV